MVRDNFENLLAKADKNKRKKENKNRNINSLQSYKKENKFN